jgi:nitroreductase
MIKDLVVKNRSYRRFEEDVDVGLETLRELVNLARLSASSANVQPLKYMLSNEPQRNAQIFPHLAWAGYIKEWPGPIEGERPSAYVIILGDKRLKKSFGCDHGIAAQSIMLGATEKGLGGCMMSSIQRPELSETLDIPSHFEILLVLALGMPKETVEIEPLGEDGDFKYWRDEQGIHHVPKRDLNDIIIS